MAETAFTTADLQARLDALLANGADQADAIRYAYMAAVLRRVATQPEMTRQPLLAKLHVMADEFSTYPTLPQEAAPQSATHSPLADLLTYIGQHALMQTAAGQPATETVTVNRNFQRNFKNQTDGRRPQAPELKSVAYFRNTWSRLSTEQQLTQTLAQAPENAGPMNSQHLVLRSLEVMRDISPDYLQGFMSYIDALIWLDFADPSRPAASRSGNGDVEKKRRVKKG